MKKIKHNMMVYTHIVYFAYYLTNLHTYIYIYILFFNNSDMFVRHVVLVTIT